MARSVAPQHGEAPTTRVEHLRRTARRSAPTTGRRPSGVGAGLVEVIVVESALTAEQAARLRSYVRLRAAQGQPLMPDDVRLAAEVAAGRLSAREFRDWTGLPAT